MLSLTPLGPRLPSVESSPRLPSEKAGLVAAAVVAASTMVAAQAAGAMAPAAIAARTRRGRTRTTIPVPSAGAIAPAGGAATIAAGAATAAATKPDFSDRNLEPDSTDGNLGPNGVAQDVPAGAQMGRICIGCVPECV